MSNKPAIEIINLNDYIQQSQDWDTTKTDYKGSADEFRFTEEMLLIPPATGNMVVPYEMTGNAWTQLLAKLASSHYGKGSTRSLPKEYIDKLPAPIRAAVMNHHLSSATDKGWMFRTREEYCRAVVAENYPIVPNTRLLEITRDAIEMLGVDPTQITVVRPWHTADRFALQLIFGVVEDFKRMNEMRDEHLRGVCIRHSEIGDGGMSLSPFVLRGACTNGVIWTNSKEGGFSMAHNQHYSATRMLMAFVDGLGKAFELTQEMLMALNQAELVELPKLNTIINGMGKQYGWSTKMLTAVAAGTENSQTKWGLIQGLTFAAHTQAANEEARINMEEMAGSLLMSPGDHFERMMQQYVRKAADARVEVEL